MTCVYQVNQSITIQYLLTSNPITTMSIGLINTIKQFNSQNKPECKFSVQLKPIKKLDLSRPGFFANTIQEKKHT